jgi:hypothetical protein
MPLQGSIVGHVQEIQHLTLNLLINTCIVQEMRQHIAFVGSGSNNKFMGNLSYVAQQDSCMANCTY